MYPHSGMSHILTFVMSVKNTRIGASRFNQAVWCADEMIQIPFNQGPLLTLRADKDGATVSLNRVWEGTIASTGKLSVLTMVKGEPYAPIFGGVKNRFLVGSCFWCIDGKIQVHLSI